MNHQSNPVRCQWLPPNETCWCQPVQRATQFHANPVQNNHLLKGAPAQKCSKDNYWPAFSAEPQCPHTASNNKHWLPGFLVKLESTLNLNAHTQARGGPARARVFSQRLFNLQWILFLHYVCYLAAKSRHDQPTLTSFREFRENSPPASQPGRGPRSSSIVKSDPWTLGFESGRKVSP